jgi:NADH:ubiquinone oxidoreductase subunit 5 (subunit L)/multisubunit Na+/H+ antiporter MnhA subunit
MIVYFWRVIEIMYIRAGDGDGNEIKVDEVPRSMLIPGLILAVLCFLIGIAWISGVLSPILEAVNSGFGLGVVP